MQRLTYSLIFTNDPKENIVREIFENLDRAGAQALQSVVHGQTHGIF
ncbi:MAG: hypothetical protein ACOX1J_07255 [Dethiobacteria bacterium]